MRTARSSSAGDYGAFALPLMVRVGSFLSLLGSASGRVFLTYLPPTMTQDALRRAQALRSISLTEPELARIKRRVRADGYATVGGDLIPGASAISAPVFTASDSLPFAMTVVLPGEQVPSRLADDVKAALLDTCRRLSAELGVSPENGEWGAVQP